MSHLLRKGSVELTKIAMKGFVVPMGYVRISILMLRKSIRGGLDMWKYVVFCMFLVVPTTTVLAQNPDSTPCYESSDPVPEQYVTAVSDDGTITLAGGGKIALFGLDLGKPSSSSKDKNSSSELNTDTVSTSQNCFSLAVKYIKRRLHQRSVKVYYIDPLLLDSKQRHPAYIVLGSGEFLNKDLIRFGLARLKDSTSITSSKAVKRCSVILQRLEDYAKKKKLGLWNGGC